MRGLGSRFWALGSGLRVEGFRGIEFRVWGLGFPVRGIEFRVWGLRFPVRGVEFRVWGLGFPV